VGEGDGRYAELLEFDAAEKRSVDDEVALRRYGRGEREGWRMAAGDVERVGDGGASRIGMFIVETCGRSNDKDINRE
jgi:hypothetical protein